MIKVEINLEETMLDGKLITARYRVWLRDDNDNVLSTTSYTLEEIRALKLALNARQDI